MLWSSLLWTQCWRCHVYIKTSVSIVHNYFKTPIYWWCRHANVFVVLYVSHAHYFSFIKKVMFSKGCPYDSGALRIYVFCTVVFPSLFVWATGWRNLWYHTSRAGIWTVGMNMMKTPGLGSKRLVNWQIPTVQIPARLVGYQRFRHVNT